MSVFKTALSVVSLASEVMAAWNVHKRVKFKNKYHDLLNRLAQERSMEGDDYFDSEIQLLEEDLETFLAAFTEEVKLENKNTSN